MKTMKKVMAVLLAVMLMIPSAVVFAADTNSSTAIDFSQAEVTIKSVTYDGTNYTKAEVKANTTVKINGKTLPKSDYTVNIVEHKNVGTYEAAVRPASAKYVLNNADGKLRVKYSIKKAANPAKAKSVTSKRGKTITIKQSGATGKSKSAYISGKKNQKYFKLKCSGNSVKVTIKSNCPAGTYKLGVTYVGDSNHKSAKKYITIKVTK